MRLLAVLLVCLAAPATAFGASAQKTILKHEQKRLPMADRVKVGNCEVVERGVTACVVRARFKGLAAPGFPTRGTCFWADATNGRQVIRLNVAACF